jgi:hypothetical protein
MKMWVVSTVNQLQFVLVLDIFWPSSHLWFRSLKSTVMCRCIQLDQMFDLDQTKCTFSACIPRTGDTDFFVSWLGCLTSFMNRSKHFSTKLRVTTLSLPMISHAHSTHSCPRQRLAVDYQNLAGAQSASSIYH